MTIIIYRQKNRESSAGKERRLKEDLTRNPDGYSGLRERFDAFCKETIKNAAYDLVRQETRKLAVEGLEAFISDEPVCYPDDTDERMVADFVAGCKRLIVTDERLMEILNRLTKRKRDVLILTVAFGYTNREAADTLGIKMETVKSTKTKAFREIREMLAEDLQNERV